MVEVIFNGSEGRIEGRYHHSQEKGAPVAVVLHPHPKHGGTMNNKIVYNLYRCFVQNGFSTLRFNFRGVGRSQGVYDEGAGELEDAATALDWLQIQNPESHRFWVGGFSFGAWISMQLLMRRPELERFIAVSPPASMYDFSFLAPCPRSGLILQGDQDSVVEEEAVGKFVDTLNRQKNITADYHVLEGADHFFRSHLEKLSEKSDTYIKEHINEPPPSI